MFSESIASSFSKKIEALSVEKRKELGKLWGEEPEKNIGKLIQLLKEINIKNNVDIDKRITETKKASKELIKERIDYQKISARLIEATNLTLESAKNISQ